MSNAVLKKFVIVVDSLYPGLEMAFHTKVFECFTQEKSPFIEQNLVIGT
jgi:hypothetical protein